MMKKKMKSRLLTFVISLAMVFTMMPMMGSEAFGESNENELEPATTMKQGAETPGGMAGKGTKENPYQIKNYDELKEFARIVNGTHDTITQNAGAVYSVQ